MNSNFYKLLNATILSSGHYQQAKLNNDLTPSDIINQQFLDYLFDDGVESFYVVPDFGDLRTKDAKAARDTWMSNHQDRPHIKSDINEILTGSIKSYNLNPLFNSLKVVDVKTPLDELKLSLPAFDYVKDIETNTGVMFILTHDMSNHNLTTKLQDRIFSLTVLRRLCDNVAVVFIDKNKPHSIISYNIKFGAGLDRANETLEKTLSQLLHYETSNENQPPNVEFRDLEVV